jgi:ribosomal protein L16/L10AE
MSKNLPSVVKNRPFKIWSKNKRFSISYINTADYFPQSINANFNLSAFNYGLVQPTRFRRVVVKSTTYGYVSADSIEAFRKVIAPYFRKRNTKIYKFIIRCYAFLPLTKKPAEVRMGGGKGSKVRGFFCPVRPGQILFEVFVRNPVSTKSLFLYASRKLSVQTKVYAV